MRNVRFFLYEAGVCYPEKITESQTFEGYEDIVFPEQKVPIQGLEQYLNSSLIKMKGNLTIHSTSDIAMRILLAMHKEKQVNVEMIYSVENGARISTIDGFDFETENGHVYFHHVDNDGRLDFYPEFEVCLTRILWRLL